MFYLKTLHNMYFENRYILNVTVINAIICTIIIIITKFFK